MTERRKPPRRRSALVGGALFLLATTLAAQELPRTSFVPGGVAIVPLAGADAPRPTVWFEGRRVMVVMHQGSWKAVIGLPLTLAPGPYVVTIEDSVRRREERIEVVAKAYPVQRIRLADERMVELSATDLARHERDRVEIERAFGAWREDETTALRFDLPVAGRLTSGFGLRRYFNDRPRAPHSGIDLAAAHGSPVRAPAAAVVTATGDYFFNGQTVFLDHGQGLVTMYNHLRRVTVAAGERVARGQLIGEVGKTGRVTGPHLHWSVSLNDARVDPMLFLSEAAIQALPAAAGHAGAR